MDEHFRAIIKKLLKEQRERKENPDAEELKKLNLSPEERAKLARLSIQLSLTAAALYSVADKLKKGLRSGRGGKCANRRSSEGGIVDRRKRFAGGTRKMSFLDFLELSSLEEFRKFQALPPINEKEYKDPDWDEFAQKVAQYANRMK